MHIGLPAEAQELLQSARNLRQDLITGYWRELFDLASAIGIKPAEAGLASGLINAGQQIGGAIGLAMTTTIAAAHTAALLRAGHPHATALTAGFHDAFAVTGGLALAAALVAVGFIRRPAAAPAASPASPGLAAAAQTISHGDGDDDYASTPRPAPSGAARGSSEGRPRRRPGAITREHLLTGDLTGKVGGPDGIEIHQVTLPPGQAAGPRTRSRRGRRYVTSSRIAFEPDGHLAQELRAGSAFFERAGAHPPFRQRVTMRSGRTPAQKQAVIKAAAEQRSKQSPVLVHGLWQGDVLDTLRREIAPALTAADARWAITGAAASLLLAPYLSDVTTLDLYVDAEFMSDKAALAARLGGRIVEKGQRIDIHELPTPMSAKGLVIEGVQVALPVRVYADLIAAAGRSAEAGHHLRETLDVGTAT